MGFLRIDGRWRNVATWLAVVLLLSYASVWAESDKGNASPDFALRAVSGENLRLSEFRGDIVVLGFWTRWCGDCREAMQALNVLHDKYERAGLVTLGVDVDDTTEQAGAMANSLGLKFPILIDAQRHASNQFELNKMPLIVLIDRDGKIRYRHTGFERGDDVIVAEQLRQLINE